VATQKATQVIDMSGGKDAQTAKWLASFFGVSVTVQPPPSPAAAAASNGGVVVILGSNEEQSFSGNPGIGS
jgi:hypothetical protein